MSSLLSSLLNFHESHCISFSFFLTTRSTDDVKIGQVVFDLYTCPSIVIFSTVTSGNISFCSMGFVYKTLFSEQFINPLS